MTRTAASALAVLCGAAAGVVVALGDRGTPAQRAEAGPVASAPRAPAPDPSSVTLGSAPPARPTTQPQPSVTAAPPPPASATVAPAFDLTPPTTREELLAVEIRCDRKVPEDCERAARALDAGVILPRDAPRARTLQRLALTLYVRQCEADRALACARLSEMHEAGEIVQKNPATARVLRARFHELCAARPSQPGCSSSP